MSTGRRSPLLVVGGVRVDVVGHRAAVGGRELTLTDTQFALLAHLMQHCGRVCTRAELMCEVWGYPVAVDSRTVDVHISQLRAKVGPELAIRTVRGVGYCVDDTSSPRRARP